MNVVFESTQSFSPLLKLEEPYDSWWLDWYPCGNQKSESCLQKYREAQQEAAALLTWEDKDATNAPSCSLFAKVEENQSSPTEVPCMALDLEHEIAVLEEQARSDGNVELSPYDDDIAFMTQAQPLSTVEVVSATTRGPVVTIPTCNVARRSYKLNKEGSIAPKVEVEDTQECSNQHCSTGFGDAGHSSEDDNATYASSVHENSSTPAPLTAASLTRKPTRHPLKPTLPTSISTNNTAALGGSCDSADNVPATDPSLTIPPGTWTEPGSLSPLKRGRGGVNSQVAGGKAKRRRGDASAASPRGQAAGGYEAGDENSGHVSQGSVNGCGTSKAAEKGGRGKQGKAKAGKAGAGSPRGRKRVVGRPAAPTPGAHSCSQCGAQSTPVWRAGPCGPKTLCNACGVRYMKVAKKK